MVLGLNIGVLGLFSLESVTMAELFGSRTRFTQLALAKEIGGILATAIGPVLAATLTAVTGSWWPIAAMLIVYSLITLVVRAGSRPRPAAATWSGWRTRYERPSSCTEPATCGSTSCPDPVPGAGEVLIAMEWGGICGSDLAYWQERRVRHRRAARTRWCSATRWPAGSPRSAPGSPAWRSGSRSPSTRPSWSATASCRTGSPGAPTCTRRSATSARRPSTRTPTAGSAS